MIDEKIILVGLLTTGYNQMAQYLILYLIEPNQVIHLLQQHIRAVDEVTVYPIYNLSMSDIRQAASPSKSISFRHAYRRIKSLA